MGTFVYPTNVELEEIAQVKVAKLTMDDPLFDIMPIVNKDTALVEWEQRDDWAGLQNLRGLGGRPTRVNRVGGKRYAYQPGYYGEYELIDEQELMTRRPYGVLSGGIDISDLVMEAQDQLLARRIDRIRYIGWTMLISATFSVNLPTGGVGHTDTYSPQTATFSAWSTAGSGTPLLDFRAAKLLSRGKGVTFGRGAKAYMNQVTFNLIAKNTNAADFGGKKSGFSTVTSLKDVNSFLMDEDLPEIVIYDEGYFPEGTTTFTPFIPNNKTLIVGSRTDGARIAAYYMVRNVNNPGMAPGPYQKTIDFSDTQVPAVIEVHDGFNGGPVIPFPAGLIVGTNT